jgi:hypothetical protein
MASAGPLFTKFTVNEADWPGTTVAAEGVMLVVATSAAGLLVTAKVNWSGATPVPPPASCAVVVVMLLTMLVLPPALGAV